MSRRSKRSKKDAVQTNRVTLVGALLCSMFFFSCASTITSIPDDARQFLSALNTTEYLPHRFKGTGTVTISEGTKVQTMWIAWMGVVPGMLRLQAFDPWRNPLFLLILKDGAFYFRSAQDNQYFTGKGSRDNLKKLLAVPFEGEDLVTVFSGRPPILPFTEAEMDETDTEDGRQRDLLLFRRYHRVVEKIEFDSEKRRVHEASFFDGWGKKQHTISFDDFKITGDGVFPHKIEIVYDSGRRITLLADKIWTRFEIPEKAFTPDLSNGK